MPGPKNTFAFFVFCLVMLSGYRLAAQQFKGEATVTKDTFIVGDSIGVKITIQGEPGHIYRLQEIPQLQGMEWLDSFVLQQDFNTGSFVFPVTGFDSGSFIFPRLYFNVYNADNDAVATAQTQALPINITYAQVDTTQDIKPIKAPIEVDYTPFPNWPFIVLGLIILLAVTYFLYRKWQKKPLAQAIEPIQLPEENLLSYGEDAIRQIQQLQAENSVQNEKQYFFELKEILRTYIQKRYQIRNQGKTSAQILGELKKKSIKQENIISLNGIFSRADLVLFAKHKLEMAEKDLAAEHAVAFIKNTMTGEENTGEA
ncbi:MAG: hypothetical protein ACXWEY_14815 [Bacteroidia bacterium]